MKQILVTGSLAVLAWGLAGCSGPTPPPTQIVDPAKLESLFEDDHTGDEISPSGGGTMGATITSTKAVKAGWYAIDMACLGSKETRFTVSSEGTTLGEGQIGCGDSGYSTTRMDLPGGKISITATSEDPATAWIVRTRPTTAPTL